MDTFARRGAFWGIVLIIIGAALLLDRLQILSLGFFTIFWPFVMLLGIVWVLRGFTRNRRGPIFWGSVVFLYGLFFFLRSVGSVDLYAHMFPPATFLIFGAAFLMVFVNDVREWYFLILSLPLLAMGFLLVLSRYGYVYWWDVWGAMHMYWPVLLILFGLGLLLRRRPDETPPAPPGGEAGGAS